MKFDEEGHLIVGPDELAQRLRGCADNEQRLVDEVLLPGTPAMFPTYDEYCEFRRKVADEVRVHPSCVVVCGSVRFGFSTTPRSGKVWRKWHSGSDIDLAIVDPDHYHLLDTEIRRWERGSRMGWWKLQPLRENRGECCFKHDHLPNDVAMVKHYKDSMETIEDWCNHPITAFFYRDWWSFSARREYDMRVLRKRIEIDYLPCAKAQPRPRESLSDQDLENCDAGCEELCLSEMEDITNTGLKALKRFENLQRLWLDDMNGITGEGLAALSELPKLKRLSVCLKPGALQLKHIAALNTVPNLEELFIDRKSFKRERLETTQSAISSVQEELQKMLPNVRIRER